MGTLRLYHHGFFTALPSTWRETARMQGFSRAIHQFAPERDAQ